MKQTLNSNLQHSNNKHSPSMKVPGLVLLFALENVEISQSALSDWPLCISEGKFCLVWQYWFAYPIGTKQTLSVLFQVWGFCLCWEYISSYIVVIFLFTHEVPVLPRVVIQMTQWPTDCLFWVLLVNLSQKMNKTPWRENLWWQYTSKTTQNFIGALVIEAQDS